MRFVANAFSLQMVSRNDLAKVRIAPCDRPTGDDLVSCIGHPDTAAVLGFPFNRVDINLSEGDTLYVAQLQGGRLPEGAKTLPKGFSFQWVEVSL